ncbi:hypothetical protein BJ170DRAFT_310429 [Xylariales sp. AK1849]|nr:hypothetical protein BJ170DRAFT_310429 [Xylariales sp. AK1849]
MRPPRIAILVFFFAACLFLLCRSITAIGRTPPAISAPASTQQSGFRSFFSFSAPFTLFPPNAIITIAEDNSTSFAARPAAFGPPLPAKGLNGQVWIGSGFTEETLQDGEESDGELGCSDVLGWDGGNSNTLLKASAKKVDDKSKSSTSSSKAKSQKRDSGPKSPMIDHGSTSHAEFKSKSKNVDDGTDDYLHESLETSSKSQNDAFGLSSSGHADIQSIQEGAEIAGKIVLLSRGGCGFLEKVKWAQRRGAVGLIVGDNQRGGPLIQMFARGDTSNVTIPSIFTSRTTAYLLSSLMQPGSFIEDIIDENGKPSYQVQHQDKARRNKKAQAQTTTVAQTPKATAVLKAKTLPSKRKTSTKAGDAVEPDNQSRGWLARIFSWGSNSKTGDRSRPPSSGQHDWVLVEDFSDEKDKVIKNSLEKALKAGSGFDSKSKIAQSSGDEFQIGVQDWRDPDLVGSPGQKDSSKGSTKSDGAPLDSKAESDKSDGKKAKDLNGPKGGSITPGSGEYSPDGPSKGKVPSGSKVERPKSNADEHGGLLSKLFRDGAAADPAESRPQPPPINTPIVEKPTPGEDTPLGEREGLWVVITPSSGASPFFDTLLVLVISPLITLTVVYALLILRARIRRRRWRAPKSVVERLPVRTYHTVAYTPSQSPRMTRSSSPSPSPSPPSPTTPLLQSQHGPSRSRPRSRTTTGVAGDLLQVNSSLQVPVSPTHEKPSQWKKYMGRQVECVVCLEEYVDGVSQVMSLPCGHEFHVECITPWLTTRRRTCPICKGDVVRSLARGSPSGPRYEPYRDDSDDDFAAQASSSNNSTRTARRVEDDSDVEQGILSPQPQGSHQQETWLSAISRSFREASSSRRSRSRGTSSGDRDR